MFILIITDKMEALSHPICDMKIKNKHLSKVKGLTALQDGGALVINYRGSQSSYQFQVVRVDLAGRTVLPIYTCEKDSYVGGIINYNDVVFILQDDGYITKYNVSNVSNTVVTYHIDVGCLSSGILIEYNQLLLSDYRNNEVFVHNTDDHSKQVVITDVNHPISVACNQDHSVIAVCEELGCCVFLYNRSYVRQAIIGSEGTADGCLRGPVCVIFSPSGSLLVADSANHRVCEFSQQGAFIRHVFSSDHGIYDPVSLSYSHPYLWVACDGGYTVKRFTMYTKYINIKNTVYEL